MGFGSIVAVSLLGALAFSVGCSKKEEVPGDSDSLGKSCELDDAESCQDGFICVAEDGKDAICVTAPGAACDKAEDSVENGGCGPFGECVVPAQTTSGSESAGGASAEGETICLLIEGALCDPEEPYCGNDLTCAETTAGETRCFGRVVLRGIVTDTTDRAAIEGAHVLALDEEGSAVTDISVSVADGGYLLDIPVLRNEDGSPVDATFTLNGAAQDYQPFPSGVRVALPIAADDAAREGDLYVLENALTDIGLIPLGDGDRVQASGSVSGLYAESHVAGLLVVATGAAGTFTAVTDLSGHFTIFNLPDGEYDIKAYGAFAQMDQGTITVAGEEVAGVALSEMDEATTTVSGNIQIVNAPGGSVTSVILVVEDTFNETAARGEVPRGLRAPSSGTVSIDGDFTIEGVPEGNYIVLAAYENDELVRDPDTNIAGTGFVRIEVKGGEDTFDIADSFKVTEALTIVGPGTDGPEAVDSLPTLEWADDSSEDWYDVYVYDAFGDEVWSSIEIPGVSGSDTVAVEYDGPLDPGMYYQFRVTSWRQPGGGDPAPISTTEDLRGVFYLPASD